MQMIMMLEYFWKAWSPIYRISRFIILVHLVLQCGTHHYSMFLNYRDISSNSLSGNIPVSLGKLDKLVTLWVASFFLVISKLDNWCFIEHRKFDLFYWSMESWFSVAMFQTIFWLDQYHLMACLPPYLKARKYSSSSQVYMFWVIMKLFDSVQFSLIHDSYGFYFISHSLHSYVLYL